MSFIYNKSWRLSLKTSLNRNRLVSLLRRKAMKNGIWMYFLQFFNTIVPLLTLPYITRVLGSSKYGTFSTALNFIGYIQVLIEYGFGMSASREVVLSSQSKDELSTIFTNVLYARLLLYCVGLLITAGFIVVFHNSVTLVLCVITLFISLLGYVFQQNWLFQGMQDMKYISLINIFGRTISVIFIFALVKTDEDVVLYSLLYSITPLFSGIAGLLIARKKYKISLHRVVFHAVINELKNGWYVFTTSLSSKVFGSIGITFLSVFAAESIVGVYSAIQKIPHILMLAWLPIGQVLYPISSQHMKNSINDGIEFINSIRKYILPLFFVIAVIMSLFSKFIVGVAFGSEYSEYHYWLRPLLFWVVVGIYNNFTGVQTLLASGHDKEYSKCFQVGVIVTIFLNLSMIYLFKGTGAAWAPLSSELFLGILLTKTVHRLNHNVDHL